MIELSKLGPFALENPLGNDPDSHVFHGFHLKQKRQAVVCILPERYAENPRARRRLEKRSRQLMKLNHPNIVRYHGAGIDQGIPFFALDYVDGISLQQHLADHGPLPWETVVEVGLQVCSALSAAHALNIHHLDIRPAHILLSGEGLKNPREPVKVQITSFWADPRWRRSSLLVFPESRQKYLSPEQFEEDPQYVDDSSDIFSLGCVLYEMITGKLPFDPAADPKERWIQPERPASLELDCPVWLDRVIMRMIEIAPDKRPTDIDAVADGLLESQEAVARGMSAIEHALTGNNGRESIIDIGVDRTEAEKLLHQQTVREHRPIRWKYIAAAVAFIVSAGMLGWALQPLSDEELLARAEPLMETTDSLRWRQAEQDYLQPLVDRYAGQEEKSKAADRAQRYIDMIQVERAEARLRNSLKMGGDFNNEAEKRWARAQALESSGNHLGAWRQYDLLAASLTTDPEDRPYQLIANREINRLEDLRLREDSARVLSISIDDFSHQAEELILSGNAAEGREIYRRIVSLYQTYPKAKDAVELAENILATPTPVAKASSNAKTKNAETNSNPMENSGTEANEPAVTNDVPKESSPTEAESPPVTNLPDAEGPPGDQPPTSELPNTRPMASPQQGSVIEL